MAAGEPRRGLGTWVVVAVVFCVAFYIVWNDPEGAWLRLRSIWNSLSDFFSKF